MLDWQRHKVYEFFQIEMDIDDLTGSSDPI